MYRTLLVLVIYSQKDTVSELLRKNVRTALLNRPPSVPTTPHPSPIPNSTTTGGDSLYSVCLWLISKESPLNYYTRLFRVSSVLDDSSRYIQKDKVCSILKHKLYSIMYIFTVLFWSYPFIQPHTFKTTCCKNTFTSINDQISRHWKTKSIKTCKLISAKSGMKPLRVLRSAVIRR